MKIGRFPNKDKAKRFYMFHVHESPRKRHKGTYFLAFYKRLRGVSYFYFITCLISPKLT